MRRLHLALAMTLGWATLAPAEPPPANPRIDMEAFLKVSREAAKHRRTRRLSEEQFLRLSSLPGTIVLDARSPESTASCTWREPST